MGSTPETVAEDLHVAIIMDGNGRWAKARHKPRLYGHEAGVDRVREITTAAREMGVRYLTLYAFSTENWRRSKIEVNGLLHLFRRFITKEEDRLVGENVRVRILGDRRAFPDDLIASMDRIEARTAVNTGVDLLVALNYGARDEIARAVRRLLDRGVKPEEVSEEDISTALDTSGIPDPDLIIRTSGEKRLSNFLLWQAAYAELAFSDTLWPDFSKDELADMIAEFKTRTRRFGAEVAGHA